MHLKTLICVMIFSDDVMIVTCIGLLVHLVVTYGTSNKPFDQVLKGFYTQFICVIIWRHCVTSFSNLIIFMLICIASTSNWLQDALMDLGHRLAFYIIDCMTLMWDELRFFAHNGRNFQGKHGD